MVLEWIDSSVMRQWVDYSRVWEWIHYSVLRDRDRSSTVRIGNG